MSPGGRHGRCILPVLKVNQKPHSLRLYCRGSRFWAALDPCTPAVKGVAPQRLAPADRTEYMRVWARSSPARRSGAWL